MQQSLPPTVNGTCFWARTPCNTSWHHAIGVVGQHPNSDVYETCRGLENCLRIQGNSDNWTTRVHKEPSLEEKAVDKLSFSSADGNRKGGMSLRAQEVHGELRVRALSAEINTNALFLRVLVISSASALKPFPLYGIRTPTYTCCYEYPHSVELVRSDQAYRRCSSEAVDVIVTGSRDGRLAAIG